MMDDDQPFVPVVTAIKREEDRSPRRHAPWKLSFNRTFDEKSSASNVEYLTQGELLTLWQQIGVLFNLCGARDGLSEADAARILSGK